MEILRSGRRLADLNVVFRSELQIALHARAGMLRTLAFITLRQQHDKSGEQAPLVFAGGNKLIDDHLRAISKISELRFPQYQSIGIIAAVAVFKAEHRGFRQNGVISLKPSLVWSKMIQRDVLLLILRVDQHGMAMIESAATAVLP